MLVLLVEGSARVRARLAERLTPHASVVEAADVAEALRAIAVAPPDVVVIDIHLDVDTGIAALRRLRKEAPGASLVVLTNEADEVHREECTRHGADAFLDKSLEFEALLELDLASKGISLDGSQRSMSDARSALGLQAWLAGSVARSG